MFAFLYQLNGVVHNVAMLASLKYKMPAWAHSPVLSAWNGKKPRFFFFCPYSLGPQWQLGLRRLLPCGSFFQVTQHIMSLETKSEAGLHKKNRMLDLQHKTKVRNCCSLSSLKQVITRKHLEFDVAQFSVFFFFFGIFIPGTELNFNLQYGIHVT